MAIRIRGIIDHDLTTEFDLIIYRFACRLSTRLRICAYVSTALPRRASAIEDDAVAQARAGGQVVEAFVDPVQREGLAQQLVQPERE